MAVSPSHCIYILCRIVICISLTAGAGCYYDVAASPVLMTGGGAVGYLHVQQLPWLPSVAELTSEPQPPSPDYSGDGTGIR